MTKELPYIYKKKTKSHPGTGVIENKELTVQGESFEQVKKEFNRQWEKE